MLALFASLGTKRGKRAFALALCGLAVISLTSITSAPKGTSSSDAQRSVLLSTPATENDASAADAEDGIAGDSLITVNDITEDARSDQEEFSPSEVVRRASKSLGGGACEWTPPEKLNETENVQSTLLVSYPGSGKRLTWRLIEALTEDVTGDDWDLSEEGYHVTSIKTSYPHPEGNWTWGPQRQMHQSILLLRNPRYALPSYHTMRHELNYSDTWTESYVRRPNTYTERATLEEWEAWRDANFDREMDRWGWLIEFWMNNGVRRGNGKALGWRKKVDDGKYYDPHCGRDIPTCAPVRVLSFEKFYDSLYGPAETTKLASAFDGLEGVQVIDPVAWTCVYEETLKKAETEPQFVNSNRDGHGPAKEAKRFTYRQLEIMRKEIDRLRVQYADTTYNGNNEVNVDVVPDMIDILNGYYDEVTQEYNYELDLALGG